MAFSIMHLCSANLSLRWRLVSPIIALYHVAFLLFCRLLLTTGLKRVRLKCHCNTIAFTAKFSVAYCELFSSPESALLLVSTNNRNLLECPTSEGCNSRTSRHSAHAQSQCLQSDWLRTRNELSAHPPKIELSWFLVLTKRSTASGDKNDCER